MMVVAESCKSTLVVVAVSCRNICLPVEVATCRNILDVLRALGEVVTCSSMVVGVNCTNTFLLAEELEEKSHHYKGYLRHFTIKKYVIIKFLNLCENKKCFN
ncbi:hypothetical protein ACJIZ3_016979 [Penstemon smallii]|uniref:Secreted protein n=1 Tax=Penstemon smallii TaxID=265156 RepID=A0ABD3SUE9_9LAMI